MGKNSRLGIALANRVAVLCAQFDFAAGDDSWDWFSSDEEGTFKRRGGSARHEEKESTFSEGLLAAANRNKIQAGRAVDTRMLGLQEMVNVLMVHKNVTDVSFAAPNTNKKIHVGDAAELISDFCGDPKWSEKSKTLCTVQELICVAGDQIEGGLRELIDRMLLRCAENARRVATMDERELFNMKGTLGGEEDEDVTDSKARASTCL